MSLVFERVGPQHISGVLRLFESAGSPCFCRYHDFTGDHRAWQMRCGQDPEKNADELRQSLEGSQVIAFVAVEEQEVCGWMRLAEPPDLSKLYENRLYRQLPCFSGSRDGIYAVACFLVDPSLRRTGVARGLLSTGIEWLRQKTGAVALEAFPRGAADVSDEEQWTGPLSLYFRAGFEKVHDFAPYPVLRLAFDRKSND